MTITKTYRRKRTSESGLTLIELLVAGAVLVFGMLSIMGLLIVAIGNNGRSKVDSTATMLNQAVLDQLSAKLAGGGPGSLTDDANCDGTGTTHSIGDDLGSSTSAGANLKGSKIDFTQAQSSIANDVNGNPFYMNYVDCTSNVKTTYDVRWDVQLLGTSSYLITVGAKPLKPLPSRFAFSIPVNMRAYVGENP